MDSLLEPLALTLEPEEFDELVEDLHNDVRRKIKKEGFAYGRNILFNLEINRFDAQYQNEGVVFHKTYDDLGLVGACDVRPKFEDRVKLRNSYLIRFKEAKSILTKILEDEKTYFKFLGMIHFGRMESRLELEECRRIFEDYGPAFLKTFDGDGFPIDYIINPKYNLETYEETLADKSLRRIYTLEPKNPLDYRSLKIIEK